MKKRGWDRPIYKKYNRAWQRNSAMSWKFCTMTALRALVRDEAFQVKAGPGHFQSTLMTCYHLVDSN